MKQKYDVLRIFPTMLCNYHCDYCTAYTRFNTLIRAKEFKTIPVKVWLDTLNDPKIHDLFTDDYQIIVSGGEPTLYKEFKELCDGLENRNIALYSNISQFAYNKICNLEKSIRIYPSFHSKMEIEKHGKDAFRMWYRRLLDVKLAGHKILAVHAPNDDSEEIQELSPWVLKTKIEGIWNDEFYSPFVNECRVRSTEMRTVQCHTQHFVVASDGDIYNCQANMWSKRENTVLMNIQNVNWSEFPEMIECDQCGSCHICSQMKAITELNGDLITDEWQYKPLLERIMQKKVA